MQALGRAEFGSSDIYLSAQLHRYALGGGPFYCYIGPGEKPLMIILHDKDLKIWIVYEAHDTPVGEYLGRKRPMGS